MCMYVSMYLVTCMYVYMHLFRLQYVYVHMYVHTYISDDVHTCTLYVRIYVSI